MSKHVHIAIFASGTGTNALEIIRKSQKDPYISFIIFSNKKDAGILDKAKKLSIPAIVFNKKELMSGDVLHLLKQQSIDLIVLAGFLWLIPIGLIKHFQRKIINIHPALLPNYGGKGMYGIHVHRAVITNREKYSGITIHYVNEHYDEGKCILQKKCNIKKSDTPESLQAEIQKMEHIFYPKVVLKLVEAIRNNRKKSIEFNKKLYGL